MTCGRNPISKYEKKDPAEDATVYLENEQPEKAIEVLEKAMNSILKKAGVPDDAAWVAVPFLNLVGYVAAGVMLERIAEKDRTKTQISVFYNRYLLARIYGLLCTIEGEEFVGRG